MWAGDENDSGAVATVLDPLRNLMRKHKASTILLYHSDKSSGGYRGSSAIGASAGLGFTLARDEGDDDRRHRRSLTCWKWRPAQKPAKAYLRLSVEGGMVLIGGVAPPDIEPPDRTAPVTDALMPKLLDALTEQPQSRAHIARAVLRPPKDRSIGRALDALETGGMAEKIGTGTPAWNVAGGKTTSGTGKSP